MAIIALKEYSRRHGIDPINACRKAREGKFKTAVKIGRDWAIDENEPYIDYRFKSGDYVGWRKYGRNNKKVMGENKG